VELLRALPAGVLDLATAFVFFATWVRPAWIGRDWVRQGMLMMLVEFLVVHSFAFLVVGGEEERSVIALLGLGAFYLLFAGAFAAAFRSWWPVLLFAWLIGGKLWALVTGGDGADAQRAYLIQVWIVSTITYFGGLLLTSILPLPRLGIVGHGRDYGIPGSGAWVDRPHRVIAFGALYFTTMGVARIVLAS
jgi:hypothetical protein